MNSLPPRVLRHDVHGNRRRGIVSGGIGLNIVGCTSLLLARGNWE